MLVVLDPCPWPRLARPWPRLVCPWPRKICKVLGLDLKVVGLTTTLMFNCNSINSMIIGSKQTGGLVYRLRDLLNHRKTWVLFPVGS